MSISSLQYFLVATEAYLPTPLTYAAELPDEPIKDFSIETLQPGTNVKVPLGARLVNGVIVGPQKQLDGDYEIKSIQAINEERPPLPKLYLDWAQWLAQYYQWPVGMVLSSCFPPLKKAKKITPTSSDPVPEVKKDQPKALTQEQSQAYQEIRQHHDFSTHLLFGVTGSGKTEVYLQLLAEKLSAGKKGLVLVPEISLTPQLLKRFSSRFPGQVAVMHSALTPREKTNQWWSMVDGQKSILIGARSALFCPIENLGLIIVDEEHEPSFKQDTKFKYNGRDAAIMLAKYHDCPVVLGSATPSLETWKNILDQKFYLHQLKSRVEGRNMPQTFVVDMKEQKEHKKYADLPFWLSDLLFEKIQHSLNQKQQVALFLNRRGMAQNVLCESCGMIMECPNCSISLTLHNDKYLSCHYCDYGLILKEECSNCHEPTMKPIGVGTELVESDIKKLFPEATVARADRDEIKTRHDLEDLIQNMENHEIDILIGTQMIAKGLDFPKLTLVGLVMADVSFNVPDFRSAERSFQLLTQVSGRSGRHTHEGGEVVIQTYNPQYPILQFSCSADFVAFAQYELENRKSLSYPPYGKLASIKIISHHSERAEKTAQLLVQRAEALKQKNSHYDAIAILGPAHAPIFKLQGKYRYHVLIKSPSSQNLNKFTQQLLSHQKWVAPATKVQIDIDPINML